MKYSIKTDDYWTQTNNFFNYVMAQYKDDLEYPCNYHYPYWKSIAKVMDEKLGVKITKGNLHQCDILTFDDEDDFILWAVKFS